MNSKLYSSTSAKVGAAVLGVMIVVTMLFGGAIAPARAQTAAELQAQITSLLATIAALQAQLATLGGSSASSA